MLYLRMLLSTMVSLYTSRVVLQVLGVDDFGIYGLVGGILSMLSFLNTSMAGATSRFLTYELGRGDFKRLSNTFSSAFIIHLLIACVIFVLGETVGLWFLCNKLVIPEERMTAAHIVYQLSILSSFISITQVPYNACITAHEKFDVYAYLELLNVALKLLIVYILVIFDYDKLILYAFLGTVVSIIIAMIYRGYCLRHYAESKLHRVWKKEYFRPLLSFSTWDLYGNGCVAVSTQGQNFIINMFLGVALNAAASIATTVSGVVKAFAYNVIMAYRPAIIKLYAQGKIDEMTTMLITASKLVSFVFAAIAIPLCIEMDYVLDIWLGNAPEYAATFCRIILLFTTFSLLSLIQGIAIHASGRIERISFITGSLFLLALPLQYVALNQHFSVVYVFVIAGLMQFIALLSNVRIAKHNIPEIRAGLVLQAFLRIFLTVALSYFIMERFSEIFRTGFIRLILITLCNLILLCLISSFLMFSKEERVVIVTKIRNKVTRSK